MYRRPWRYDDLWHVAGTIGTLGSLAESNLLLLSRSRLPAATEPLSRGLLDVGRLVPLREVADETRRGHRATSFFGSGSAISRGSTLCTSPCRVQIRRALASESRFSASSPFSCAAYSFLPSSSFLAIRSGVYRSRRSCTWESHRPVVGSLVR